MEFVKINKAQVSIEFSLLLLISLFAIGIISAFIFLVQKDYKNLITYKATQYDKNRLFLRAEEICYSGHGSKRPLQLITKLKKGDLNFLEKIKCEISSEDELYGMVEIENVDGKIIIRKVKNE
jgi:uncharacterized protein (UPF0333 family)